LNNINNPPRISKTPLKSTKNCLKGINEGVILI